MIIGIIGTALLTGLHYPVALFYVARTLAGLPGETQSEIRGVLRLRMLLLFLAWLAGMGAAGITFVLYDGGEKGAYAALGASGFIFHAVWWPFVVPIFRAMEFELKSRGLERDQQPDSPVRVASLAPRTVSTYLRTWMRVLPFAIGLAGVGAVGVRAAQYPPIEPRIQLLVAVFTLSGLAFLAIWSFWIRKEVSISYPAGGPESVAAARVEAAESLRRFRVLGIYWLQQAAAVTFFGASILCIESARGAISEAAVGVYGAIAGTAVGFAGACFGILASIRTHHALRNENPESAVNGGVSGQMP